MKHRRNLVVGLLMVCGLAAGAKNKKKIILPADVLQAETVLVVIDPDAGMAVDAPMANRKARADVEQALMNWGRFRMAMTAAEADLVISVRKGNGKIAQPTIGGIPNNDDPVILQPSPTDPRVGGQRGTPPPLGGGGSNFPGQSPHPQVEAGSPEDMFQVFRGQRASPLDYPPVWRYAAKDGLRSPGVPAVEEFRKAVVEAEKQLANQP